MDFFFKKAWLFRQWCTYEVVNGENIDTNDLTQISVI